MSVSILDQKTVSDGRCNATVYCTSQDTKPTGIFCTGAVCVEVDSGKVFFYDQGVDGWFESGSDTPPNCTVSFDMQSHGTQVDALTVAWNTAATAPTPPTETGYTFGGWYVDPGCETAWVWTDKVLNTMTLYAKWTLVEYTITYNGLSGATNSPNNPAKFTILDEIVFEPATKEGYTFDGWYTSNAYTTEMEGIAKGTHTNKNTYAKFTEIEEEASVS